MISTENSPFFSNVGKIVGFFTRAAGSGFLFCACDQTSQIININTQIIKRTATTGKRIGLISISSPDNFLNDMRKAVNDHPDGFIVNNINELILQSGKEFIQEMNFSRDILISLETPMAFWLSEKNISRFANLASDFFIRRDRSVIIFPALSGHSSLNRMDPFFSPMFQGTTNYKDLKVKIELLEKQLAEAEKRGYDEKRIAFEIVADLIHLYNEAFLSKEAQSVLEKYGKYFENSSETEHKEIIANLYLNLGKFDDAFDIYSTCKKKYENSNEQQSLSRVYASIGIALLHKGDWDKSIEYHLKAKEIYEQNEDTIGLIRTYSNIGSVYQKKGEWDKAIEFFTKSKEINLNEEDPSMMGVVINHIGMSYLRKGKFDKAYEFFLESRDIFNKEGELNGLAGAYQGIGLVYEAKGKSKIEFFLESGDIFNKQGELNGLAGTYQGIEIAYEAKRYLNKALSCYLKSEKLLIETGRLSELGCIYNSIGLLYYIQSKYKNALIFFQKSLKIRNEVADKAGFGVIYNNIGLIYVEQGKWDKAVESYFHSESIKMEVGDQEGLALTWFNIGAIYTYFYKKISSPFYKKKSKAFLLAASYLGTILGMDHEMTKWESFLKPVLDEIGEKKFMAEGETFYRQFIRQNNLETRKKELEEFTHHFGTWTQK